MSQFSMDMEHMEQMMEDEGMLMDLELDGMMQDDRALMLTRTVTPETQCRKTSENAIALARQGQPLPAVVNGQEQIVTPRMASMMELDLPDANSNPNPNRNNPQVHAEASDGMGGAPTANIALTGHTADLLKTPMIPEGKPLAHQVALMDALPTPALPAPSPAFGHSQQHQGATSAARTARTFNEMVAASTAASASLLASPFPPATHQAPKRKRSHRRVATEGSFDFLYKQQQMEQEFSVQQKVATGEPILGPPEPPKHDPLNVMAHSFVKETQLRLVSGGSPPPPPPRRPSDEASDDSEPTPFRSGAPFAAPSAGMNAAAPSSFMAASAGAPNPFMTASAPAAPSITMLDSQEQEQSVIALDGTDDDNDCIQLQDSASAADDTLEFDDKGSATGTEEEDADEPQPSRLSLFLDTLQAQADLQNQELLQEQQHQQRHSINVDVPTQHQQQQQQYQQDYHQHHEHPPPTQRQKRRHRRVVSDMGPSYSGWFQFDMSDMIEDRALWMK